MHESYVQCPIRVGIFALSSHNLVRAIPLVPLFALFTLINVSLTDMARKSGLVRCVLVCFRVTIEVFAPYKVNSDLDFLCWVPLNEHEKERFLSSRIVGIGRDSVKQFLVTQSHHKRTER